MKSEKKLLTEIIGRSVSPAKVNLFLQITGRRSDGYHEIDTLFMPLAQPADIITVATSTERGITITSNSSSIPLDHSNLCYKAAEVFAELANIEPSWTIDIQKNIPVAAGLGGGSSNAATVLKILNDNIKHIDEELLRRAAVELGADVPFFLDPRPAVASGIGEKLVSLTSTLKLHMLLVNPCFPVSAKWAYIKFSENSEIGLARDGKDDQLHNLIDILSKGTTKDLPKTIVNDLVPGVYEKFPIMELITEQLRDSNALCVGMSGSGPTMFAICESQDDVAKLAEQIKEEWGDSVLCLPAQTEG